jgi:thioredoxin 1
LAGGWSRDPALDFAYRQDDDDNRLPRAPATVESNSARTAVRVGSPRKGRALTGPTFATVSEFDRYLHGAGTPVLVDFWAPWCGPCRQLGPVVDSIDAELGDAVEVVKVNVDDHPELAEHYQVSGVPTLVLFEDGAPVHRMQGARPKAAILAALHTFM